MGVAAVCLLHRLPDFPARLSASAIDLLTRQGRGMLRIIVAVVIAVGGAVIALTAPPTAEADECPSGSYWSKSHQTCVERPDNNSAGATAQCADGLYSHSESPNASENCSGHGGVVKECPCGGAAAAPGRSFSDPQFLTYLQESG